MNCETEQLFGDQMIQNLEDGITDFHFIDTIPEIKNLAIWLKRYTNAHMYLMRDNVWRVLEL